MGRERLWPDCIGEMLKIEFIHPGGRFPPVYGLTRGLAELKSFVQRRGVPYRNGIYSTAPSST